MSSERTEAPTGRRLHEARQEGRVARSQELAAAVALLAGTLLLKNTGGQLIGQLSQITMTTLSDLQLAAQITDTGLKSGWLGNRVIQDLAKIGPSMAILLLGLLVCGVAVNVAQTGLLWAPKKLGFKLERLNPLDGIKRLVSLNGFVELVKAMLKLFVIGWVAYSFLVSRVETILALSLMDMSSGIQVWANMALSLASRVALVYLVIASADYAYQRWQHTKSLKMTKEEVKEDHKQSEGDPFIRSRLRGMQRRMAKMRMMANVPKADVIITNPTHLALAIRYDSQEMRAPKVLAKGADNLAFRIIEIARKHNIAVVQNIPVARALYAAVEIDQEIPAELYVAVAEILAYVYRVQGRRAGASNQPARQLIN